MHASLTELVRPVHSMLWVITAYNVASRIQSQVVKIVDVPNNCALAQQVDNMAEAFTASKGASKSEMQRKT